MEFPYEEILKRAFRFTWGHKWLWVLGLFIMGQGGSDIIGVISDNLPTQINVTDLQSAQNLLTSFLAQSPARIVLIILAGLILILFIMLLNSLAKPSVITSIVGLADKREVSFKKALAKGRLYLARIFSLNVANLAVILISFVLLGAPVYFLYTRGLESKAVILGAIGLGIFLLFNIFVSFVVTYAANFIAVANYSLRRAIQDAIDLAGRYWIVSLLQAILILLLYTAASLAFLAVVAIGGLFLKGLVFLADKFFDFSLAAFSDFAGPALLILVSLLFGAVVAVWQTSVWTLTFLELVKRQKSEEEEHARVRTMPESTRG